MSGLWLDKEGVLEELGDSGPFLGVLGEEPLQEVFQGGAKLEALWELQLVLLGVDLHLNFALGVERDPPLAHERVQTHSKGPNVGRLRQVPFFGDYVAFGSGEGSSALAVEEPGSLPDVVAGDREVCELDEAVVPVEQDVVKLDVPVDHPRLLMEVQDSCPQLLEQESCHLFNILGLEGLSQVLEDALVEYIDLLLKVPLRQLTQICHLQDQIHVVMLLGVYDLIQSHQIVMVE
mmetsp:Transcript_34356/g.33560  ORF Transcript_34356/g.33560 Transcript_34356/m.33560 type:complete len:234 (-) Transcript_34356:347-1048(-)